MLKFELFNPWNKLGITRGGYADDQDLAAIYVLQGIGMRMNTMTIANTYELDAMLVELWQYIFCSNKLAEFDSSPRACFPLNDAEINNWIEAWSFYYQQEWGKLPDPPARVVWAAKHERPLPLSKDDETLFRVTKE